MSKTPTVKQSLSKALSASALPLPVKVLIASKLDKLSEAEITQYAHDARLLVLPILDNEGACGVLTRWGVDVAQVRAFIETV